MDLTNELNITMIWLKAELGIKPIVKLPERELAAAVLCRAIQDLYCEGNSFRAKAIRQSAWNWFFAEPARRNKKVPLFQFLDICDTLDLAASDILAFVKKKPAIKDLYSRRIRRD